LAECGALGVEQVTSRHCSIVATMKDGTSGPRRLRAEEALF
jgi:hypothetical protein